MKRKAPTRTPAEQNARTVKIMAALSAMQRETLHALRDEVWKLKQQNSNRGGQSYQGYHRVYHLAGRYYRCLLRHNPKYLPGKAATVVHARCLKSPRYRLVPTQKSITRFLKKNKSRLIP